MTQVWQLILQCFSQTLKHKKNKSTDQKMTLKKKRYKKFMIHGRTFIIQTIKI